MSKDQELYDGDLLSAYVDGELSAQDAAAFEARRRWQWSDHFGRIAVALVAALGLGILAGQQWTAAQYEAQQARQKLL